MIDNNLRRRAAAAELSRRVCFSANVTAADQLRTLLSGIGSAATLRAPIARLAADLAVGDAAAAARSILADFFAAAPRPPVASRPEVPTLPGEAMRADAARRRALFARTLTGDAPAPAQVPGREDPPHGKVGAIEDGPGADARNLEAATMLLGELAKRSEPARSVVLEAAGRLRSWAASSKAARQADGLRKLADHLQQSIRGQVPESMSAQAVRGQIDVAMRRGAGVLEVDAIQRANAEFDQLVAAGAPLRMTRESYVEMSLARSGHNSKK